MDTIPRSHVVRAVQRLGLDPTKVQELSADTEYITVTRRIPIWKNRDLMIEALAILGYEAHDVQGFELDGKELHIALIDRDEHGHGHGTRTEVCNIGG